MRRVIDGLVKVAAFARKEAVDVVRQPRLILTLVLGPFLILALFGIGYQQEFDPLRVVIVIDEDNVELRRQVESRLDDISSSFELEGITSNRGEAARRVRDGDLDAAVIAPEDPYATVRGGERATFVLLHNTLDPIERATVNLIANAAFDAINRELIAGVVTAGQQETGDVAPLLLASKESAALMRAALDGGELDEAADQRDVLAEQLAGIAAMLAGADALESSLGDGGESNIRGARERAAALREVLAEADTPQEQSAALAEVEGQLAEMETVVEDLRGIPAEILVSPLDVETQVVGAVPVGLTDYYAPGVIALLLQHLAITFAALALVREERLGTPEVFQVAPVGATHILGGKFLGYIGWMALIAAALSGLVFAVFGVPLVGSLVDYAIAIALLIVASLAIGFVISSLVQSDTQAVNITMIILLLSTFFSGFFMPLERLIEPVRAVSWMLPMTHGLAAMRDVMFRGNTIGPNTSVPLALGAVVAFVAAWALLRARLQRH
ncbi:MAG TPA: ABC transporter permease [Acidimicrobiia bacterium]|nr:ABC transporter permease [Acidimicrobiia bacterium]